MTQEKLINYISGNLDALEAQKAREWINASRENKNKFIRLKNIYALSGRSIKGLSADIEYREISDKLSFGKYSNTYKLFKAALKYAAIVVFALLVGYGTSELRFFSKNHSERLAFNEIIVPYGQISEFILSDGTHVWLNSGTTIKFPSRFDKYQREVFLEGEAYFEVSKNKDRPFFVHSGQMITKVLGTEFNISAYKNNSTIETTLINGAVEILDSGYIKVVHLEPGHQFIHFIKDNTNVVKVIDTKPFKAWKNGELVFRNKTLEEMVVKLERWYNVEIIFLNEDIKKYRFSGTILKEKPFDQVLQAIQLTLPIAYQIDIHPNAKNRIVLYSLN